MKQAIQKSKVGVDFSDMSEEEENAEDGLTFEAITLDTKEKLFNITNGIKLETH